MGEGGFARVFKVQRISDGEIFALKFMEPSTQDDRDSIKNEIGIMQMSQSDSIIRCHEAFDY